MQALAPVAWFVGLAYALSGAVALVLYLSGMRENRLVATALSVVFMFGPAVAAWIVARRFVSRGSRGALLGLPSDPAPVGGGLRPRLFVNRWWAVGWLIPVVLVLLTVGVSLLLPYLSYDPAMTSLLERLRGSLPPEQFAKAQEQLQSLPVHPFWLGIPQGLLAGLSINAVAAFGEELGWRGLLFRHLAPLGFWRGSLLTGGIWGLWHAPLILQGHNYPAHPGWGVLWMVVFCLLLSPLLHWVRLRSQSVLAAAVMHGSINGLFVLPTLVIKGGNDLTSGATGVPGFAALAVACMALAVVLKLRPAWARPPTATVVPTKPPGFDRMAS